LLERSQVEEILFGARREVLTCLLENVPLAIGFCEQALGLIGIFRTEGESGETFRFLQAEGIGFITYLKGRGAKPRNAANQFKAGWFAFEGKRHTYQLFEKKTRVRGVGLIRTVLFVGDDGPVRSQFGIGT
jgi:hypothetical protein